MSANTRSLDGWSISCAAETEWAPWGSADNARAKVLGTADGYTLAFVQADAGYRGTVHEHAHAEFFFLVDGSVRTQGKVLTAGDGVSRISAHVEGRRTPLITPRSMRASSGLDQAACVAPRGSTCCAPWCTTGPERHEE
jgi:hypothetical protein